MSDPKEVTINLLHSLVLREVESEAVQEVDPDLYCGIAEFVGGLKKQEFDGVENKIKNALVDMASELAAVLVRIRLEKKAAGADLSNMLDAEKYILGSEEERRERTEVVLSAMLDGKARLLDYVSQTHKTRLTTVRFLQETGEFVGADLAKYGPYQAEDIATLPHDNAQALISKKIAAGVRMEGG